MAVGMIIIEIHAISEVDHLIDTAESVREAVFVGVAHMGDMADQRVVQQVKNVHRLIIEIDHQENIAMNTVNQMNLVWQKWKRCLINHERKRKTISLIAARTLSRSGKHEFRNLKTSFASIKLLETKLFYYIQLFLILHPFKMK